MSSATCPKRCPRLSCFDRPLLAQLLGDARDSRPAEGVVAGGETLVVLFDYGHFTAVYEAIISDVAEFDAGIDVLTSTQRFRLTYDTPYIRHLPTSSPSPPRQTK